MLQTDFANNAVSFTVNLKESQLPSEEEMESLLMRYLPTLKGTTVFVEKSRKNMPIQGITKEQFDAYKGRKQILLVEDNCKNGCPIEPMRDSAPKRRIEV